MSISRRELRVAVATDTGVFAWQARCVEALMAIPGIVLAHWVQVPLTAPRSEARSGARALAPGSHVPSALLALGQDPSTSRPTPTVDVLLDLSSSGVAPPVAWADEVWRFRYGHAQLHDVVRAALLSYIESPGQTWVTMVREPDGSAIREGWISWKRGDQLDRLLLDPAEWPALAARDRVALPEEADPPGSTQINATPPPPGWRDTRDDRFSSAPMPILRVAAIGRRLLGATDALLQHDNWNVGVVAAPIEFMLDGASVPKIDWWPTRPGHFAADPFGIERDGVLHVIFEDYDQHVGIGSIMHVAIRSDGSTSDPRPVIDPGVHASYPYLVETAGEVFMVPETSATGDLDLYQAASFPYEWRRIATILHEIPAVDPTIIQHEGLWWLFATRADRGPNHSLSIWYADDLLGPWKPHTKNPVKIDSRSSRPGGTPFVVDGTLYRPAQDDSRIYGERLIINRVDVLTPTTFIEVPVKAIAPEPGSPYPDGLHTLSAVGNRTLVDGNHRRLAKGTLGNTVKAKGRSATKTMTAIRRSR